MRVRLEEMNIVEQYAEKIYPRIRNCTWCGNLRLQNCFKCAQEEVCETFPNCKHPPTEYYPPELAYIGEDYGKNLPKILFVAQIVAWDIKNVAERETGELADVVPTHDTYPQFLQEFRLGFSGYAIIKRKYGVLDIFRHVVGDPALFDPLSHLAYTNAAKCPNRSGMESNPNQGHTTSQARIDIATMLANCRVYLIEEVQVLDPEIVVTFDRSLLLALGKNPSPTEPTVSLEEKIGGRNRLFMSFYHPSMAGVNYPRTAVSFDERVHLIHHYLKK